MGSKHHRYKHIHFLSLFFFFHCFDRAINTKYLQYIHVVEQDALDSGLLAFPQHEQKGTDGDSCAHLGMNSSKPMRAVSC